ncbi:hypothetical protein L9F63_011585, partial [Diploptera punctata]
NTRNKKTLYIAQEEKIWKKIKLPQNRICTFLLQDTHFERHINDLKNQIHSLRRRNTIELRKRQDFYYDIDCCYRNRNRLKRPKQVHDDHNDRVI